MTTPADSLPSNYRFADLTLDVARRSVSRQGEPVEIKALDFDLLRFLVESAPNVVNADVLAEKVWGRHFVSPENVAQRVMLLRQSLSDDANRPRYIETVRNKGYRLIPVVERVATQTNRPATRHRWLAAAAATVLVVVALTVTAGYWLTGLQPLPKSAEERERIERVSTTDPRARDLYLIAGARNALSAEVFLAINEAEEARALDAEFKEAWLLEAQLHTYAQFVDPEHDDEHRLRAEQAANRAIALDPELGQAHAALGWTLLTKRDWAGAERAFRNAVGLNAPTADLGPYAFLQISAGKFNAFAYDIYEERRAAEPQNELTHRMLAFLHEGRGEWARANDVYDSALSLFQTDSRATLNVVNQKMHWLVGRHELADAYTIRTDDKLSAAMLASLNTPEQALGVLREAHAAGGNPVHRRDIGLWAAHFGDPELAFDALRAAIDEQGGQIIYVWLPQAAAMRRLPAFKTYMHDIGMVAYWQEYGWPPLCRPLDDHDFECD